MADLIGKAGFADALRRGFAWLVFAMGLSMVERQLPRTAFAVVTVVALATLPLVTRKKQHQPCITSLP